MTCKFRQRKSQQRAHTIRLVIRSSLPYPIVVTAYDYTTYTLQIVLYFIDAKSEYNTICKLLLSLCRI